MSTSMGALIRFASVAQATNAVNMANGTIMVGFTTPLTVRFADSSSKSRRSQQNSNGFKNDGGGRSPKKINHSKNNNNNNNSKLPRRNTEDSIAEGANSDLSFSSDKEANHAEYRLKLNNLPTKCDDLFLYKNFAPFGAICWVRTALDNEIMCSSGLGYVAFKKKKDAESASVYLSNTKIGERAVNIVKSF